MTKLLSKIINIILIVILTTSLSIFSISLLHKTPVKESTKTENVSPLKSLEEKVESKIEQKPKISWEAILTSFMSLITFIIKWWYEKWKLDNPAGKKETKNDPPAPVKHPMFSMIDELLLTEIKNLNLGSLGRTELFKLMLTEQIRAYEEESKNFLTLSFTNSVDFREKARNVILNAVGKYEERWKTLNIPEPVICRYKGLQADKIKLLLADVDTIAFYRLAEDASNCEEVSFYLLTHIAAILKLAVTADTLKTLRELNGELKTIQYNGMTL